MWLQNSGASARLWLTTMTGILLTGAAAAAAVPLPTPRPADAPASADRPMQKPPGEDGADSAGKDNAGTAAPPPPSACRLALTDAIAIAPTLPPISGPGSCGGDDLVRLEAVVLPDRSRVPLKPAATLRCTMAAAVAEWVRGDVAVMAAELKTQVAELDNYDSYNCRGRNNVSGAKMSEHGRANALDLRGIRFANGQTVALTEMQTPREQREKVLHSLCARFSTVLGPGSDGYHEDHIHLDLAERRSGYRICQWVVIDPMPKIAPLMPALRPEDAPARESGEEDAKRQKDEPSPQEPAPVAAAPSNTPGKKDAAPAPASAKPQAAKPQATGVAEKAAAPTEKPKRQRRARREPSLFESIFQPELGPKRKKGAGPAGASR